jgi:hypothetical protein
MEHNQKIIVRALGLNSQQTENIKFEISRIEKVIAKLEDGEIPAQKLRLEWLKTEKLF